MGDFNFDLLKIDDESCRMYEDLILTSIFSPLISTFTHAKPNCRRTCIDNILTNMPEKILASGTIQESVTHHLPIFQISSYNTDSNIDESEVTATFYDFSKENISKFAKQIGEEFENIDFDSINSFTFSEFSETFNDTLDKVCKLDQPKFSKRTKKANPWITDSIIRAVKHKRKLYKTWKKTKSKRVTRGGDCDKRKRKKKERSFLSMFF